MSPFSYVGSASSFRSRTVSGAARAGANAVSATPETPSTIAAVQQDCDCILSSLAVRAMPLRVAALMEASRPQA